MSCTEVCLVRAPLGAAFGPWTSAETHDPTLPSPVPGHCHTALVLGSAATRAPCLRTFSLRRWTLPTTAASCNNFCDSCGATPDPDVAAARAQFRLTIHDDAAWHQGNTTRNQSYSPTCVTHTLDTLRQQATEDTALSSNFNRFQEQAPGSLEGLPPPTSIGMPISSERHCNTAAASPSPHRAAKVLNASATTPRSAPRAGDQNRLRSLPGSRAPSSKGLLQLRTDTDGLLPPTRWKEHDTRSRHLTVATQNVAECKTIKRTFHATANRCHQNDIRFTQEVFDGSLNVSPHKQRHQP